MRVSFVIKKAHFSYNDSENFAILQVKCRYKCYFLFKIVNHSVGFLVSVYARSQFLFRIISIFQLLVKFEDEMLKQNYISIVLIANIYLIDVAHTVGLGK